MSALALLSALAGLLLLVPGADAAKFNGAPGAPWETAPGLAAQIMGTQGSIPRGWGPRACRGLAARDWIARLDCAHVMGLQVRTASAGVWDLA
eukprot:gene4232-14348_t